MGRFALRRRRNRSRLVVHLRYGEAARKRHITYIYSSKSRASVGEAKEAVEGHDLNKLGYCNL